MKCLGNGKVIIPIKGYDDKIYVYDTKASSYKITETGKLTGWDKNWRYIIFAETNDYIGLAYNGNDNRLCIGWIPSENLYKSEGEIANYNDRDGVYRGGSEILNNQVINGVVFSRTAIQERDETAKLRLELESLKEENNRLESKLLKLEKENNELKNAEYKESTKENILAIVSEGDIITVPDLIYDKLIRVIKSTFDMNRECTKYKSLETLSYDNYCVVSLTEYTLGGKNQRLNILKKYVNDDADDIDIEQLKVKYEDWVKSRRQSFSV